MKKALKKLLYGDITITDFVSIPEPLDEKVILKIKAQEFDVSDFHWLVCLQPMIYGVWLTLKQLESWPDENHEINFEFLSGKKVLARVKLVLAHRIGLDGGSLYLLKQTSCSIYHSSSLEAYFLYKRFYKKPELPQEKFRSLVAAYSFPRKVRLVSIVKNDYYNLFPMDLLGPVAGTNKFIFGLRHSNISLNKIIAGRKIAVIDFSFSHKQEAFALGKHHSSSPLPISKLGFSVLKTRFFEFPFPEWASAYYEIEVQRSLNLGSQMFLLGEIKYHEERIKNSNGLYEIHFLYFLYLKRKERINFPNE